MGSCSSQVNYEMMGAPTSLFSSPSNYRAEMVARWDVVTGSLLNCLPVRVLTNTSSGEEPHSASCSS